MKLRDLPARLSTGAYILHSGLEKWRAGDDTAAAVHGMAAASYPVLDRLAPEQFLRMLAAAEIATGALLIVPVVPSSVAGGALTGFSAGLMGLYVRTPGLRRPGSVWPTPQGIGISKDMWLLGIGLSLVADTWSSRRRRRLAAHT
jgi:uncharacterized membrane protein YphA (DoxX/SURF4 family)